VAVVSPQNFDTDVFVVGGGPAGLAAAIAARQHGLQVIVADCATPPIDKACGEGLMPDAQPALRQLGITISSEDVGEFQGIKFIGPESEVAASFPRGKGIGVRRTLLHQVLLDFALSLGVQIFWGTRVSMVSDTSVQMGHSIMRTRWVVGADGQHSRLRDWAGLSPAREHARRVGIRRHFQTGPWSDYVEIYWGSEGQAYVTPIGKKEICVALISRKKFSSFEAGIAHFPALARHLQNAPYTTSARGAVTVSRRLKSVVRGRVALIGEASGSVDAITGEGLAMAFRQAVVLGKALAADDLSLYKAAHRQISNLPALMAHSMLFMDKSSWVRRHALRAFAAEPALFERLLKVHVGELSMRDFGMRGILDLGWRLLAA
jgi:menaquinone-9 beta-reductase